MKKFAWSLAVALLASGCPAWGQDVPTPAWMPSTPQANAWIDADPSVVQARSAAEAAQHGATAVAAGTHEWTAKLQGQRRRLQGSGANSHEWSAQIERSFRVNGKAALDEELRDIEAETGRARVGEARHEAARALADLWVEALAAQRRQVLLNEQLGFARTNLEAVDKRKRAGDASVLDQNLARADLGEVQRELAKANTGIAKLKAQLRVRFGGAELDGTDLPNPNPPIWPEPRWRERVLEEADPLKVAEGEWRKSRVLAARVRADRVPDPTIGVFTANEAFHNERIVGISLTIPLSGTYRAERSLQAEKEAQAARSGVDQARLEIEVEMAETYAESTGALEQWRLAEEAATTGSESARLMQRAYTLGEAGMESLLLARRQHLEAALAALEARADAVRWENRLLIDAHLIWDLARD